MKKLVIIGSGEMGREVFNLALICHGFNRDYTIKGFIDYNVDPLDVEYFSNRGYPPIICSIKQYIVEPNDVFVCSTGNVARKKENIEIILKKGGEFINLIHPSASINHNAQIGKGCIISQNATIGCDSKIGDFVLIQISTIIGHDVCIGNYSRVDCHAVCIGRSVIEDEVTIHTAAVINYKIVIGKGACVGASSFVIRNVKENSTVHGNPAIRLK